MLFSFFKWLIYLGLVLAVSVWAFLQFHPVFGGTPDAASLARIQASANFDGKTFVNQEPTPVLVPAPNEEPENRLISLVKWGLSKLKTEEGKNPSEPLPSVALDVAQLQNGSVAWFGHSSVLFQTANKRFMTDPVFYRASPVPFTGEPFAMTHKPTIAELPELDVVLISHDHYDHLDYLAIEEINPKTKRFIVPLGVKAHLQRWGVADEKITELDWYEETLVDDVRVILVPARHFSGRKMDNNGTLWGGYVVKSPDLSLYFSADSGYGQHYLDIAKRYAPFDFVMIENGAYDPHWAFIHEAPEQTAQALQDIQATKAMPIHWAKFDLANHHWTDPIERLLTASKGLNVEVATPKIGQVFQIHQPLPQEKWWETVK